jgi:hypothetical protein
MRLSSRRYQMMVARYEMPGRQAGTIRPGGNGLIRRFRSHPSPKTMERPVQPNHTVPSGTGFPVPRFQAFHAWLPSFGPSGTSRVGNDGHAAERQARNTRTFRHAARQDSRTACPTKPKLYSAGRSSRPRKRGTLHNKDIGEVGRTSTKRQTPNAERRTPNAYAP